MVSTSDRITSPDHTNPRRRPTPEAYDENNIGRKLRSRTARLLGTDAASEKRIRDNVQEHYDVRSDIVHNRLHKLTPERVHSGFVKGFDLARQSLFKLLCEGPPEDWNRPLVSGDRG